MSVQICEIYACLGFKDRLQFGDPYTDEFNPYRVKQDANAIVDPIILSKIRRTVQDLTEKLVLNQDTQLPQSNPRWEFIQPSFVMS